MPHIPRAICFECNIEMICIKNDYVVEMLREDGTGYYKICTDLWGCPRCEKKIVIGFADHPFAMRYNEGYERHEVDLVAEFR